MKRIDNKESVTEVRSLLEYLYLDVKVRSPEEVGFLRGDFLFEYRFNNSRTLNFNRNEQN